MPENRMVEAKFTIPYEELSRFRRIFEIGVAVCRWMDTADTDREQDSKVFEIGAYYLLVTRKP